MCVCVCVRVSNCKRRTKKETENTKLFTLMLTKAIAELREHVATNMGK